MLGLQWACIVSALLPKTQYLREQIYQVLFSLLVHHYYKVAILVYCGDIVSPTILSSRCWYRFAKSAMDFFGCCMPTKNSLTVQDSVIWLMLFFAPILLYSFYKVARAPLRSVEYWEIGRKRHMQLSLLLRAITLHCDLQLFLWLNAESRGGFEGFGADP